MKKTFRKTIASIMAIILLLSSFSAVLTASAEEYASGYYTYTVLNEEATITECDTDISGAVVIPSTLGGYPVKTIATRAFFGCEKITNLTIPSGIVLKLEAFSGCSSLKSLVVGEGVYIGERAFSSCEALETIVLADNVATDDSAFQWCTSLETVVGEDNVNIGYSAFWKSDNIKTVKFGANATIGENCFDDNSSLETAMFAENAKIGDSAFFECVNLNKLVLGDNAEIGAYAFKGCYNLDNVTYGRNPSIGYAAFQSCRKLPNNLVLEGNVTIGDQAFYECDSLLSVSLPDGAVIGEHAFAWSDNISTVTVGDDVTIKNYAFDECYKINEVVIGNNTVIGEGVFQNTKNVSIGNNAVIGVMAFNDATSLTSVLIGDDAVIGDYAFYYKETLVNLTIGDRATVGENAFYYCSGLENVDIGTCKAIEDSGFYGCSGIEYILFEDNATIGGFALYDCPDLIYVHIPSTVTDIGGSILEYNTSAYICSDNTSCYAKTYADDNEFIFKLCNHSGSNPEIPEEPEVPDDESIASGTCGELDWVIDKDGVLTVSGTGAVPDYPEGSSNAPWYQYRDLITKIVISNGVTVIGISAFRGLIAVIEIYISASVNEIRDGAFSQCESLLNIIVDLQNAHYSSDGYGVLFNKNKTLLIQYPTGSIRNSYTVPATVIEICDWAFSYCKYIFTIIIGTNVLTIGNNVFKLCINLRNVYYAGNKEQWERIVIGGEGNDPLFNSSFGWNADDVEITVFINTPSKTTVNYGDTLVLTLNEFEVPSGMKIEWVVEGSGVEVDVRNNGKVCLLTSAANGEVRVTVKLIDSNNSQKTFDEITITSRAGFFQKLISFFKNLFGINRVFY